MATTLQTGANTQVEAQNVRVAIDWPAANGSSLDASAYLLGASGKVRGDHDMVFFNQPSGADGAIKVAGSTPDSIRFEVDLTAIPAAIERIVFCVTVDAAASGINLSRHAGLKLQVTDTGGGGLVDYAPDLGQASEAAMMVAELYRRNGWKLRAIGQGFNGGLAPLARSFGIDVADEPAPPPPPPPPPPPAAPVNLSKISLDKARPSVSLEKRGSSFGEIRINLNWNRGKKSFFGSSNAIDLDLGCFFELNDGNAGVIQALGRRFGDFHRLPFVALSGDDRTGDVADGETMRINGAQWSLFRRIAIFAYIYEGAPNWASTDGVVTITAPDQPPIEVRMTEGRNDRGFCGIALLENDNGALRITRLVEYYRDHSEYDQRLGFGFRWTAGSKD